MTAHLILRVRWEWVGASLRISCQSLPRPEQAIPGMCTHRRGPALQVVQHDPCLLRLRAGQHLESGFGQDQDSENGGAFDDSEAGEICDVNKVNQRVDVLDPCTTEPTSEHSGPKTPQSGQTAARHDLAANLCSTGWKDRDKVLRVSSRS